LQGFDSCRLHRRLQKFKHDIYSVIAFVSASRGAQTSPTIGRSSALSLE
jgi:hypothetical protein